MRDVLESKSFELVEIHTNQYVSNMMAKVVTKYKHLFCRGGVDMVKASHAG